MDKNITMGKTLFGRKSHAWRFYRTGLHFSRCGLMRDIDGEPIQLAFEITCKSCNKLLASDKAVTDDTHPEPPQH